MIDVTEMTIVEVENVILERDRLRAINADLLAALKEMDRWFGKYPEFVPSREYVEQSIMAGEQARAAIARAEQVKP